MQYRQLGRSGLRVSEVSLGSWLTLGDALDAKATTRLVRRAFELGINFFDTADAYGGGAAEEALARAVADLPRHHLVIATKCFFPQSGDPNDRGLSRKHIFESVERSLRRLGTDYLDLEQCHRPDPETPVAETVRAFEDLIRQGKILYWGVSEWSAAQVLEACRCADVHGAYRPISSQPHYSIAWRVIERELLPVCEREGLGQVVYSPLAQGVLTGKYGGGRRPGDSRASDSAHNQYMGELLDESFLAHIERLRPLAQDAGLSMAQLALAWCLRLPGISSVITGASREGQLEENVQAAGRTLPPDVLKAIEELFPAPQS